MTARLSWLSALLLLAGCASQPAPQPGAPGFWPGLFHGLTALPALIASLFVPLRPYAFPNSGFWYDAGFSLGVSVFILTLVLLSMARIGGFITRGH